MVHISKAKIKFVQSLKRKKSRDKHGAFIVEGKKGIQTAINSGLQPHYITGLEEALTPFADVECFVATEQELRAMSQLHSVPRLLAVFPIWDLPPFQDAVIEKGVAIYVDRIQDPGNLGTIIRAADWFGARHILLSSGCADLFNVKTVQAAKGSLHAVTCYRAAWPLSNTIPTIALDMDGEPLHAINEIPPRMILVIGNEGQGVDTRILEECTKIVSIAGDTDRSAESLNAAMACSIALHQLTSAQIK